MDNRIKIDPLRNIPTTTGTSWLDTTTTTGTSWSDVCALRDIVPTTTTTNIITVQAGDNSIKTTDYTKFYKKIADTFAKGTKEEMNTTTINVEKVNFELSSRTKIQSIKVYVPGKVMGVRIDGHEYKQVVKEPDEFSMEFGCALAIAKYKFGKALTPEGIELAAHMLLYLKCVKDEIRRAIRAYNENEARRSKIKKEKEKIRAIKERRRAKAKKKREAKRLKMNGVTITLTEKDGKEFTNKEN